MTQRNEIAKSRCLICGSDELVTRFRGLRDVAGLTDVLYSFLACSSCGSLTAEPIPSPDEIPGLYPENYTLRENGSGSRLTRMVSSLMWWGYSRWTYAGDVAAVIQATGVRKGRLLDVGCGSGIHLGLFKRAGFTVEGLEMSAEEGEYTRKTLGCLVHQGFIEDIPKDLGPFEVVTLFNTLEHLSNVRESLTRVRDHLVPGGWLVAKVPVADGWQPRLLGSRWRNLAEVPRHIVIPSTGGLAKLMNAVGFSRVKLGRASTMESACMLGTSIYPWAVPYRSSARGGSGVTKLLHTAMGGLLTYLSIPEAVLETAFGSPSTVIIAASRPT